MIFDHMQYEARYANYVNLYTCVLCTVNTKYVTQSP